MIGQSSRAKCRQLAVVSDIDSHSQCRMRVTVEDGHVVVISGDPTDPECRGQLTLRGENFLDILYAPDRLQHPLKHVGDRGAGTWERISWDEALNNVAAFRLGHSFISASSRGGSL